DEAGFSEVGGLCGELGAAKLGVERHELGGALFYPPFERFGGARLLADIGECDDESTIRHRIAANLDHLISRHEPDLERFLCRYDEPDPLFDGSCKLALRRAGILHDDTKDFLD